MSSERTLEAHCIELQHENLSLKEHIANLQLALLDRLDRPIPQQLPPYDFPDAPWAKIAEVGEPMRVES